jgi:uncharacterized spore protein YtfJ
MDMANDIGTRITEGLESLTGPLTVRDVFSSPHEIGDRIVITAASVEKAGGFGFGAGGDADESGGGGGGGGGNVQGRPVAVIDVGPEGVTVHPVLDVTRIGVAVIATLVALLRMARRR